MRRAPINPNRGRAQLNGRGFRATNAPAILPTRKVNYRAIPCPECGAGVGERCAMAGSNTHSARKRMAIRADNEARAGLPPEDNRARKPGALEDPNGRECPSCGLTIAVLPSGAMKAHNTHGGGSTPTTIPCPGVGARDGRVRPTERSN